MKSSDELVKLMKKGTYQLCLVGEPFYMQLFINYNLFGVSELFIESKYTVGAFWSKDITLKFIDLQSIAENMAVVFCGLDTRIKDDYPNAYNFFDFSLK